MWLWMFLKLLLFSFACVNTFECSSNCSVIWMMKVKVGTISFTLNPSTTFRVFAMHIPPLLPILCQSPPDAFSRLPGRAPVRLTMAELLWCQIWAENSTEGFPQTTSQCVFVNLAGLYQYPGLHGTQRSNCFPFPFRCMMAAEACSPQRMISDCYLQSIYPQPQLFGESIAFHGFPDRFWVQFHPTLAPSSVYNSKAYSSKWYGLKEEGKNQCLCISLPVF